MVGLFNLGVQKSILCAEHMQLYNSTSKEKIEEEHEEYETKTLIRELFLTLAEGITKLLTFS